MLGKLIKYDLKSMLGTCGIIYLAAFVFCVINAIFIAMSANINFTNLTVLGIYQILNTVFLFFNKIFLFLIMPITIFVIIRRFYRNIFSKEGYLTNTLPVSHHKILVSKILSAICVFIVSCLVYLGLSIIFSNITDISLITKALKIQSDVDVITWYLISSMIVFVVLCLISNLIFIYLTVSIGHMSKHRFLASIGSYLAIYYLVIQPIFLLVTYVMIVDDTRGFTVTYLTLEPIANAIWIYNILLLVFAVVSYWLTSLIMKKKLNLI